MPYKAELHDDDHIFYIAFSDPLTFPELLAAFEEDRNNRDRMQHKVHTLIDLRHLKGLPPNAMRGRESPSLTHRTKGQIAIIGANNLLRKMAEIAFRLAHFEAVKFMETEEEAWAYLRQVIAEENKSSTST